MFARFSFLFVVFLVGMASFFVGKSLGITSNWGEVAVGGCAAALAMAVFYWLTGGWRHSARKG
jgi:hypothetical protein